ncbi:MAG TPA: signal peptide peptidase SppA [Gemmataceae bacterium]|nr:signal peptide peptidase SppA [Gemmataceae bacterium]
MSTAYPPPLPRRRSWGCFLTLLLAASVLLNLFLCGVLVWPEQEDDGPREKHLYGPKLARDKVAVVRAEGPLVESLDAHIIKQIQKAGRDSAVKAVVVRIDSPGGTIGASEDIHRELSRLRAGKHPRFPEYKAIPVVASMGSIAASGGYYIAMPASKVFAEKATLTGSIGVYAALPNVSKLASEHGVRLVLIKAGGIKGSGSPLHELTAEERQPWQDMVDQAYDQFLDVVAKGRPALTKEQLKSEVVIRKQANVYDDKGNVDPGPDGKPKQVPVERVRADGGSFTAQEAKQFGLIDDFGLLEDAVTAAATAAGLGEFRVVHYERPPSLWNVLLGANARADGTPDLHQLAVGLTPRLWYMAPQCELTGILAASAPR